MKPEVRRQTKKVLVLDSQEGHLKNSALVKDCSHYVAGKARSSQKLKLMSVMDVALDAIVMNEELIAETTSTINIISLLNYYYPNLPVYIISPPLYMKNLDSSETLTKPSTYSAEGMFEMQKEMRKKEQQIKLDALYKKLGRVRLTPETKQVNLIYLQEKFMSIYTQLFESSSKSQRKVIWKNITGLAEKYKYQISPLHLRRAWRKFKNENK